MSKIEWQKTCESFFLGDLFKEAAKQLTTGTHLFKVVSGPSSKVQGHASWQLYSAVGHRSRDFVTIKPGTKWLTAGIVYNEYEVNHYGHALAQSLEQYYCLWHHQFSDGKKFIVATVTDKFSVQLRIGEEYNEQC